MTVPTTVKISSRYQIALPSRVRRELDIKAGDRLLVDVQDNILILMPEPEDYVAQMSGLHGEIWSEVDVEDYLNAERDAWTNQAKR
ncbi:MAG: AbrB/MazE/SpoVT family DNA-binding domain-containing protein [Anaerolineae bacterium]